ncbi:MAG: hypothetical protein R3F30_08520 [Planctomycetota bacterium]
MHAPLVTSVALLVTTGLLGAQTSHVSPAAWTTIDAYTYTTYPFRLSNVTTGRYQSYELVHDLPPAAKGKLSGLALRREGFATGSQWLDAPSPPVKATLEVRVSTAAVTSTTITSSLVGNHGSDLTTVLAKKVVTFATLPRIPGVPTQPFLYKFPFDSGKALAFVGNRSLCCEVEVFDHDLYDPTTSSYKYLYFDYFVSTTSGRVAQSGRGCYGSNTASILPYQGYFTSYYDTTAKALQLYGAAYNGVSGGASVALLSAGRLPVGVKLPGDCWLYIDPALQFLSVPGSGIYYNGTRSTTHYVPPYIANNSVQQVVTSPWNPSWVGLTFEVQMLGVDPGANALGLTLSNLVTVGLPSFSPSGLGGAFAIRYRSGTGFYEAAYANAGTVARFTFD